MNKGEPVLNLDLNGDFLKGSILCKNNLGVGDVGKWLISRDRGNVIHETCIEIFKEFQIGFGNQSEFG